MANENNPVPSWVPGACIGLAIVVGMLATQHMPSSNWWLRLLMGAALAGVLVLGFLYLAQWFFKRR